MPCAQVESASLFWAAKAGAPAGKHARHSSKPTFLLKANGESLPALISGAEGKGLCWQACPVLKLNPPPSWAAKAGAPAGKHARHSSKPTFLPKANGESLPALSGAEGKGLCWQACPVL